ncbi:AMP-binding protein [Sphingomonas immobilis]|uniref:AMP-binding protein n=1 Tax=Sphingomonas immobilis TaxID=3063997 RepID=A0ABT9A0H8_9SPHN|nr:AMP-binding protein [Sphingomonas sp. CA1-15]MDO7842197.1 AMP-binding protein [Sphingomonas sp. CA1-15]
MSILTYARTTPGKPAVIAAESGESIDFERLNGDSMRLARVLRRSLGEGARVALLMENVTAVYPAAWACRRAGLRFVPVNWHLSRDEAAYILTNSDAEALIVSPGLADLANDLAELVPDLKLLLTSGAPFGRFESLDAVIAAEPAEPFGIETEGNYMFYSSGTTGQPKGILRALSGDPFNTLLRIEQMMAGLFTFDDQSVFYSPAPLYHAAPMGWSMGAQVLGGTAIVPRKFDAEATLAHIERYRITHAQFVPTHFVRMLQLPPEVRAKYDVSTLKMVVHAAAPCPVDVKEAMFDWFGPVIYEYYGLSEGGGFTIVRPDEWLAHKGTVGRSVTGPIHVVDDDGKELPAGEVGHLMFENPEIFDYHKEPAKTAAFFDDRGWSRPGDMGWMDADGYLFLADRSSNMIISGGVNIYPQEAEAVLTLHPAIRDVAVIGVPDKDFGEAVKAVVELKAGHVESEALAQEILDYCRARLSKFKCPKSVDFVAELPRLPTGKLLKRELRKTYWGDGPNQIITAASPAAQ